MPTRYTGPVNTADVDIKYQFQKQASFPVRSGANVVTGYETPANDTFTNTNGKIFKFKLPGSGVLLGSTMCFDFDCKVTGGTGILNRNASCIIDYIEIYVGSKRIQRIENYGILKTNFDNLRWTQSEINSIARIGEGVPAFATTGTAQHYTLSFIKDHVLWDKIPLHRLGQVEIWIQCDKRIERYTGGSATAIEVTNPRLYFSRITSGPILSAYNTPMTIWYLDYETKEDQYASTGGTSVTKTFKYDVNYSSLKGFMWFSRLTADVTDVTKADKYDSLMQRNAMISYKFRFNGRPISETYNVGSPLPTMAFRNLMTLRGRFRDGTRESSSYPAFYTENATTGYGGTQFIIGYLFAAHRHVLSGIDTSKANSGLEFITDITTSAQQSAFGCLIYDKLFAIGGGKNPVAMDSQ